MLCQTLENASYPTQFTNEVSISGAEPDPEVQPPGSPQGGMQGRSSQGRERK